MRNADNAAYGQVYIWGDNKYSAENPDEDLWGDDDVIYEPFQQVGATNPAYIYGGDGDDQMYVNYTGFEGYYRGENGDDFIKQDANYGTYYIWGNDGNDTV